MKARTSLSSDFERAPFLGFEHLTANFVYCPNQFLDVCIPNCSRGTVRLVAYLLRRTLGWLDEAGRPIEKEITVSYRKLIECAGISRGSLREAIEEAIACGFIVCTQQGSAKAKSASSQHSRFALRWDGSSKYAKNLKEFSGFFQDNGNRTPIPNVFFESIVPQETHAVVKVVGTVLRHTVGYENQFGIGRRKQAPLSYSYIQRFGNIKNRSSLSEALKHSIAAGYVECVDNGQFHSEMTEQSTASYAVRWLPEGKKSDIGSKNVPGVSDRFKKRTSIGSKNVPEDRFRKRTSRKTTEKNTLKQQLEQKQVPSVVVDLEGIKLLKLAGFPGATAAKLSQQQPLDVIRKQVEWIEDRNPQDNKLGMLRCAIEENWSEPAGLKKQHRHERSRQREQEQDAKRAAEQMTLRETQEKKQQMRAKRIAEFRRLPEDEKSKLWDEAVAEATNPFMRARLVRERKYKNPPNEVLALLST
jgi:hypothetical protein